MPHNCSRRAWVASGTGWIVRLWGRAMSLGGLGGGVSGFIGERRKSRAASRYWCRAVLVEVLTGVSGSRRLMCEEVPSRAVLFATQRSRSDRGGRVRLVMRDTSCRAFSVGQGMLLAGVFLDPPFILSGVQRGVMPRAPGDVFAKAGCSAATSGHHGAKRISEGGCGEKRTVGGGHRGEVADEGVRVWWFM